MVGGKVLIASCWLRNAAINWPDCDFLVGGLGHLQTVYLLQGWGAEEVVWLWCWDQGWWELLFSGEALWHGALVEETLADLLCLEVKVCF